MKIFLRLALLLFVCQFQSCDDVEDEAELDFDLNFTESIVIKVPEEYANTPPENLPDTIDYTLILDDIKVEANASSLFEPGSTTNEVVSGIKAAKFSITITDPQDSNLSFLNSVNVYISSTGVAETKLAWKDVVADSVGGQLNLDISSADLIKYMKEDTFNLRVVAKLDKPISVDHKVDLNYIFAVSAGLLN